VANNQLLASDNFASGSLAAGWSAIHTMTECNVVANGSSPSGYVTEPTATSTSCGQTWTGSAWESDQISEITLGPNFTSESGSYAIPMVRVQSGAYSGYQLDISSGSVLIYKVVAGSQTQLASLGTSGATAGDVWSFVAAGSVLVVYQNGKFVGAACDTTYTSGSPGFFLYSTVNVAHPQVSSWRGYNIQQQDGIWTKQKIAIPVLSADTEQAGSNTCSVLYEGNAQILSGAVFKMWFGIGWQSTDAAIYYAESSDGLNWTISNSAIISDKLEPIVFKYNGTYYLYCQAYTAPLGTIFAYTSPDGINWTLQNSTALQEGSAGAWDSGGLYALTPIAVVGGVWYALYGGYDTNWATGLATSTDGINWTKSASNPVISAVSFAAGACAYVNGIAYIWIGTATQGTGASENTDPTESVRYQSTDFIHWVNPTHSVHHSEMFEAINATSGQGLAGSLITVGSKTYLYTQASSPFDKGPGSFYQILVATTPATLAQLVTNPEDATEEVASDAFTSGAGNLDGNWTTPTGGTALKIVSGPYVEPTVTNTICQAVYTGDSFSSNQYCDVVIEALTGTLAQSVIYPMVRASTTALTDYEGWIASPTATSDAAAKIYKRVAGTATQIGPTATVEPQVGDVWRLSVFTGSDGFPVLSLYQNGFLILQVQDQSATPITSGNPGIAAYSSLAIGDAQISMWDGGNANVIPTYPISNLQNWMPTYRDFVNKRGLR
jgi:hypothetical protein